MAKTSRYILYFLVGVGIYYLIGADENPAVIEDFHRFAPVFIVGIFIVLFTMRQRRKKRDEQNKD